MTALTRLRLQDFRNYKTLDLHLDGRHVCLYGANGAGKTNLLEAVSQLGPGRGLRGTSLVHLMRMGGHGGWTIAAELDGEHRLGVGLETTPSGLSKRIVRIDGASASASDLAERMRIVWLTPAMDGIFSGGASDRRRFFDRQVMAHIPSHGRAASQYEKAMRERNALLEQPRVDPAWADALEARMAEAGAELIYNRAYVLTRLQNAIDGREEGYFPKADLSLTESDTPLSVTSGGHGELAGALVETFRAGRRRDAVAGRTLSGPHRADLRVLHRPTGAPANRCSTGQQKALLIGLILASARGLAAEASEPGPVLLLDEAAAHLDAARRGALFDEICDLGGQAWLTGTEAFLFEAFGDRTQRFQISEGAVDPG